MHPSIMTLILGALVFILALWSIFILIRSGRVVRHPSVAFLTRLLFTTLMAGMTTGLFYGIELSVKTGQIPKEIVRFLDNSWIVPGTFGVYIILFFDIIRNLVRLPLAGQASSPLAVLMVDVDHFKEYNDKYDHLVGDQVLREVAERIARSSRESNDIVSRYGEGGFLILAKNTTQEGAIRLAKRVSQTISDHPFLEIEITVSIGLAFCVLESNMQVIDEADQALMRAKQAGRNCVCWTTTGGPRVWRPAAYNRETAH